MTFDRRRAAAPPIAVLALLGLVAACSDDADQGRASTSTTVAGTSGDAGEVAAADEWLDDWDRLDAAGRASLELAAVDRGPGATHVHYGQSFAGIPVRGAEVIVHLDGAGEVIGANSTYTDARPPTDVEQTVDQDEATEAASDVAPGDVLTTVSAREVWLPDGDTLRLGWSVVQTTEAGGHQVWVDAVTGEVADAHGLRPTAVPMQSGDGCEIEASDAPAACVFLPDPFFANGGETPDVDETDELLTPVPLLGLDDPDSGHLVGEFVDTEPADAPVDPTIERDGLWTQGRGEDGFEAAMAYFWVDRVQRLIQDLGFDDVRNEPFPIVPIDPDVEDNAFFDGASQEIHLGVGPADGINEGEDANGIVHEYGHAVLDAQVPSMLGRTGDAGAYHEGFGDLLAVLATLELRNGDVPCLFIWTDQSCLRRVDTDKRYPDDLVNEVHEDGEIYSGAVFDILTGLLDGEEVDLDDCAGTDDCNAVRDRVVTTLLASHQFLTGAESLPEIATAYLQANATAFGGDDADLIADAFAGHGLDGGGGSVFDGDGEPTGATPAVEVRVDIDHSFRGDLSVEVHVVDDDFNELCTPLRLIAPDPDDGRQGVVGRADVSATECAALVPPSPERRWVLAVVDTAAQDEGTVNGFQVVVEGRPFLGAAVPARIADDDPSGTTVIAEG